MKTNADWSTKKQDASLFDDLLEFLTVDKKAFDEGAYNKEGDVEDEDENIFSWCNRYVTLTLTYERQLSTVCVNHICAYDAHPR